jgi:hypothetical protein
MFIDTSSDMSDDELVTAIATSTGRARGATAMLVAHLAELERRGLLHALGFKTLYPYCRSVLHLSEHESYNRMEAAGVARRFPVVLPMLAEGLLHMTAVCLLGPHLGDENHLALLGGSIHKSKREIEALVAGWFPKDAVASSIRKLSGPRAEMRIADSGDVKEADQPVGGSPTTVGEDDGTGFLRPQAATTPSSPRPVVAPLAPNRHLVKFTATDATIARLREAQELLSDSVPSGDMAEIFDQALIALLEKARRRKYAATTKPRRPRPMAPTSRAVPAAVEREVWARDGGRCAFVGRAGHRCEERRWIDFHHVKPWAASGPPTATNIALRCRTHNAYEATAYFDPIRVARVAREMELVPERVREANG